MSPIEYKLSIAKDLVDLVRSLHPHLKKKVKLALQTIVEDPSSGKALKEELKRLRSFRVSKFRIIYRIGQNETIEIIAIGPRRKIYIETYRLMKKDE